MSIEAINWAFKQNIKPTSKLVLIALANYADDHEICWPRVSTLSKITCLSKSGVKNALRYLSENGMITRAERAGNRGNDTNVYRLHISDKCISDHPLSVFVEGVTSCPPRGQDVTGGGHLVPPRGSYAAPLEPVKNQQPTKYIYNTLTRDAFLREIDGGINDGTFEEFGHLTETEINHAAIECYEFLITELKEPKTGTACVFASRYIRNGIRMKKIRKGVKQGGDVAPIEDKNPNPVQLWQEKLKDTMDGHLWRSWIRPLWHDGGDYLCAPTKFHATEAKKRHGDEINAVLRGVEIIHKPYQPEKEHENA